MFLGSTLLLCVIAVSEKQILHAGFRVIKFTSTSQIEDFSYFQAEALYGRDLEVQKIKIKSTNCPKTCCG